MWVLGRAIAGNTAVHQTFKLRDANFRSGPRKSSTRNVLFGHGVTHVLEEGHPDSPKLGYPKAEEGAGGQGAYGGAGGEVRGVQVPVLEVVVH